MNSEFVFIQAGHTVTVYERNDRVGGLLRYGIPTMKLSKEVRVISSLSLFVLQNPLHNTEQTGESAFVPPSLPLSLYSVLQNPHHKTEQTVRVVSSFPPSLPPFLSLFCAAESLP